MNKIKEFAKKHKKAVAAAAIGVGALAAIKLKKSFEPSTAIEMAKDTTSLPANMRDTLVKPTAKLLELGFDGLDEGDTYYEAMNDMCLFKVKDLAKFKEALLDLPEVTEESDIYILFNVTKDILKQATEAIK